MGFNEWFIAHWGGSLPRWISQARCWRWHGCPLHSWWMLGSCSLGPPWCSRRSAPLLCWRCFFFKGEPHFLGAGWVFSCFGGMRNMKIWGSHNFIIMFLLKMVNNPAKWWISSAILWSYELQWWAKQQTGSSATTCGSVQYILWRKMDNEQWPNIPNRVNGSKYDLQRFLDTLVPHWSNPELMLNTRPEPLAIWVYSRFGGWDWSK